MESQRHKSANIPVFEIPVEVLISLTTGPALVLLIANKAIGSLIGEFSQRSEELFRGDRLPTVPFPGSPKRET